MPTAAQFTERVRRERIDFVDLEHHIWVQRPTTTCSWSMCCAMR
jgi:hypothetical protein